MLKKLRRKFIFILMSIVTLILLAIFVSMLLGVQGNSRRMSEEMLRQALTSPILQDGFPPPNGFEPKPPEKEHKRWTPILVGEISAEGEVSFNPEQFYFIDEDKAKLAASEILDNHKNSGVLNEYKLRFLISEDGTRLALADISTEQEMTKNLIINSVLIGTAGLTAFFLVSLFLSKWAVRPVEIAWERQRRFVADASHELKTPLTVILSNAEMLRSRGTFPEKKEARRLEHIQAEAVRMKKLVEDLLSLAESDNIERTKIREIIDLSYLVTNSVLTFEPIAFDEGKKIIYDLQNKISVMGDSQRLQQLISILLDNAVKYSVTGSSIHISLKEENKKNAVLIVRNDGEIIPEEESSQIFERFYRVDKSRSVHGSFGLGLSIAESIVREHNGKIWLESNSETGNSFFVTLPLC